MMLTYITQTLYIFFGIAALIGLFAGTLLHYCSAFLISLGPASMRGPDPPLRTAASVRKARKNQEQERLVSPRKLLTTQGPFSYEELKPKDLLKDYADWLDKDKGRRREGLLAQTILEEDDDSEDGF